MLVPYLPTQVQMADLGGLQRQLAELEEQAASSDLWDEQRRAQARRLAAVSLLGCSLASNDTPA